MKLRSFLLLLTLWAGSLAFAQAAQAPAGQAPAGQAPAGQAPAGQAPAGQAPAGQAPAGQAPAAQGAQAPAGQPAQQKKQITDPAEYNTYVAAINEKDPAKKIQDLDAFLQKYPNTVVKEDALDLKMVTQLQAGQPADQAAATARQILQVNPNNLHALAVLASIFTQTPLSETDPQLQQKLSDAERDAKAGLQSLEHFTAPNVSPEELKKSKDQAAATFHEELGVVAMGRKDFAAAQQEFKQAAELSPNNATLFYRLGNAYILERPNPKYPEAFWELARAATLDGPGALPPAGRKQVEDYLKQAYTRFHGSDEGLADLEAKAKAEPFPPADFKVMSKAEVIEAQPVDPTNMQFDEVRDLLLKGTAKSEELWSKLKGTTRNYTGMVVSATPSAHPRTLRLAVMQPTAEKAVAILKKNPDAPDAPYDVEMSLATPAAATAAQVGKIVEFSGLVNAYNKDPYSLVLVDGKLKGQEAPAAKKAPGRKAPTRRRR